MESIKDEFLLSLHSRNATLSLEEMIDTFADFIYQKSKETDPKSEIGESLNDLTCQLEKSYWALWETSNA